jgi:adenylate cyclase
VNDRVELRIYRDGRPLKSEEFNGALELGRQDAGEEPPFHRYRRNPCDRLVLAPRNEDRVSRKQALLELRPPGRIQVTNLSKTIPITVENGPVLSPGEVRELAVPINMTLGTVVVGVEVVDPQAKPLQSLPDVTPSPNQSLSSLQLFPGLLNPKARKGAVDEQQREVLRWLQTSMSVFQSAATSSDFFQKAAQAIVEIAGLDTGGILLLNGQEWEIRATASGPSHSNANNWDADDWRPSQTMLRRMLHEKKTFWELPEGSVDLVKSLGGVSAVVASPLRAASGDVVGAVYGDRRGHPATTPRVSEVEAMLVELIATAVAGGMARLKQEQAALEERVRFAQFFTKELSESLAQQPDLLKGRDEEVTLLFCDIRGFSSVSGRLGPEKTLEWVGDVMSELSDRVLAHKGVLVDYIGDELMAMWGAPSAQPQHAGLACRAATDMLAALPELNARWQATLGEEMAFGIGVNSGVARVGNTGSRHKFKYGPLGNTVNLASRVQGATKYLKAPILITAATRSQLAKESLGKEYSVRRLCRVRVVNIEEPVELYELAAPDRAGWEDLRQGYETALESFERKDFRRAAKVASALLENWQDDGPCQLLLSRAAEHLLNPEKEFDSVVKLPGK